MWGTDWPVCEKWTTYRETLSAVRDDMKFLNEEDKTWILSKTVEQVWPFPESALSSESIGMIALKAKS